MEEKAEVSNLFDRLFDHVQMREWFSKDSQALTEQGILLPGGSSKRPDRIIVQKQQAVVIDFKTGEEKEDHQNQVREYMELVKGLTQKPTEGYLVYIESGEIRKVSASI